MLYGSFEKETASYPIESVTFQTERVFQRIILILPAIGDWLRDEETETWLDVIEPLMH